MGRGNSTSGPGGNVPRRALSHDELVANSEVRNEPGVLETSAIIKKQFDYAEVYAIPDFYKVLSVDNTVDPPVESREDIYIREDGELRIESGPNPIGYGQMTAPDDEFNEDGVWIGPDRQIPFRRLTASVTRKLPSSDIEYVFALYKNGDYGSGEVGFAVYEVSGQKVYLIDDAVRTPEGYPPGRDVSSSPGPLTLMLPSDY